MSGPFGAGELQLFGGVGSFYPHTIDQSLRFEDGDSGQLNLTPSSAGNRKTWTLSAWVKRTTLSNSISQAILSAGDYSQSQTRDNERVFIYQDQIYWDYSKRVSGTYTTRSTVYTSAVFRDPSAWYNIVVRKDVSNSTTADKLIIYVNGVRQTLTISYSVDDVNGEISESGELHRIGLVDPAYAPLPYDGYLAEVNFVDGTALDPTSFGETKAGIWIPKDTSGLTFGTNGFRLKFQDSSAIGDDTSGNGNDFTTVSPLAATDVVLDSPTNNWATMNPLDGNGPTISEGNLKVFGDTSFSVFEGFKGTFPMSSGKWYWEVYIDVGGFTQTGITPTTNTAVGSSTNLSYHTDAMTYESNGNKAIGTGGTGTAPSSRTTTSYGASYTDGDIIGVALDLDSSTTTLTFYKNNSSQGTAFSSLASDEYVPVHTGIQNNFGIFNFGQDSSFAGNKTAQGNTDGNGNGDFYYTPPSGFLACCTANLPDPGIDPAQGEEPEDYFNTVLYTGNGSTQSITGVGHQPDFVWSKQRNASANHRLFDSVRGAGKNLISNLTSSEGTDANTLTSFDSDGFSLGNSAQVNDSGDTYVSWNWLAGGSAVSNTDGSIASSVSANTEAGFSILTFTGNGSGSATVGTGLDRLDMVIVKSRDTSRNWWVAHKDMSGNLQLDSTTALITSAGSGGKLKDIPSLSDGALIEFVSGSSNVNNVNASGEDYVAYCFKEIDGYLSVGSYSGNGSSDGSFIYTGFRPSWVMTKRFDSTGGWVIVDNKRNTQNLVNNYLRPDSNTNELTTNISDFLSNGFKLRSTTHNESSSSYMYLAFAEQPFKYSNSR